MTLTHASHTPRNESDYQDLLKLLCENDAQVTGIDLRFLPDELILDVAAALGRALTGNTTVSFVALSVHSLLTLDDDAMAPLLQYFRASSTLLSLRLVATLSIDASMQNRLVQVARTVAENSSIASFDCSVGRDGLSLPASVLQTAPHVTHFLLTLCDHDDYDDSHRLVLANAFSTTQTLTYVFLAYGNSACGMVNDILNQLATSPTLSHVSLCRSPLDSVDDDATTATHVYAIEHFIRSSVSLQSTSFSGYNFDDSFDVLSSFTKSSCQKFTFGSCKFDGEATNKFVQFVQEMSGRHTLAVVCNLEFEGSTFANVMVKALRGSRVHRLNLYKSQRRPGLDVPALFDLLSVDQSKVSFSRLRIDSLSVTEEPAFARFLRSSTRLHFCSIKSLDDGVDHEDFVNAMRQNGSLRGVRCGSLGSAHTSILTNICKRNSVLPQRLNRLGSDTPLPFLQMVPAVFLAGQDARRTAPNTMLIGLRSAADCLGPRCVDPKRARPEKSTQEV